MRPILNAIAAQRGYLFPWAAVCYGTGIAIYFALAQEPSQAVIALTIGAAIGIGCCAYYVGENLSVIIMVAVFVLLGGAIAAMQARLVVAPVLDFRYYGPVEGTITKIDRSASGVPRVTLEYVVLGTVPRGETPENVRVSLHGEQAKFPLVPGTRVILTANLSPPQGPAEPGGFDFRRAAWFEQLGAVGYSRTPILRLAAPSESWRYSLAQFRQRFIEHIKQNTDPEISGFAVAIMAGDRNNIPADTLQSLRDTNLAHLLAISGLHMGLLVGLIYGAVRFVFAAIPRIALYYPTQKIAAVVAIFGAAFYLVLSGGNVATQRAFVMVTVVLCAVLLDKRAFTINAVALAAFIVMTFAPYSVTGPGFQMSFSATVALVVVFRKMRDLDQSLFPRWARPIFALFISSLVAGLATAPFAMAHFNRVPHFGLLANLLSVPMMGLVVMPAALAALIADIVGLGAPFYALMSFGIKWILGVADWVSGFEHAVSLVFSPNRLVLPLIAVSGIWVLLWQGNGKIIGLVGGVFAAIAWAGAERPDILVSESGRLIGVIAPEGRALNKPRGDGFVAGIWLENDGDNATQGQANARWEGDDHAVQLPKGHWIWVINGRGAQQRIQEHCTEGAIIVTARQIDTELDCLIFDETHLSETGSIAIRMQVESYEIVTAAQVSGERLWTQ